MRTGLNINGLSALIHVANNRIVQLSKQVGLPLKMEDFKLKELVKDSNFDSSLVEQIGEDLTMYDPQCAVDHWKYMENIFRNLGLPDDEAKFATMAAYYQALQKCLTNLQMRWNVTERF